MKRWCISILLLFVLVGWAVPAGAAAGHLSFSLPADGAKVAAPVPVMFDCDIPPATGFTLRSEVARGTNATTGFVTARLGNVFESPTSRVLRYYQWDASGYSGGPYTFRVTVVDAFTDQVICQGTRSFTLDAPDVSPAVTLEVPAGALSGLISIAAGVTKTVAELDGWRLEAQDPLGKRVTLAEGRTAGAVPSQMDVGDLADGSYTIRLSAWDQLGNERVVERKAQVHNLPPSPVLAAINTDAALVTVPIQYSAVSPVTVQVTMTSADGQTEAARGEGTGSKGQNVTTDIPLNLRDLAPGEYQASVRIEDAMHRVGTGRLSLNIFPPLPPAQFDELPAYSEGEVRLSVTLPEGVAFTRLEVHRSGPDGDVVRQGPDLSRLHHFVLPDRPLAEGQYIYRVVLITSDGRRSESAGRVTVLDRTPPVPGDVSVAPVDGQGLNIRWTAATDTVGLKGYEVTIRDSAGEPTTASAGVRESSLMVRLTPGEYTAVFAALDNAGHRAEVGPIPFRVQAGAISLMRAGRFLPTDVPGFLEAGRTWVPLRFFGEALGYQVAWNGAKQVATVADKASGRLVMASVGDPTLTVVNADGSQQTIPIAAAPRLVEGRVLVPLRALAEALGAEVTWHQELQTVELK